MKMFATVFFMAAAMMIQGLYRCPCQDARKPGEDQKILACAGSGLPCECGCTGEEPVV